MEAATDERVDVDRGFGAALTLMVLGVAVAVVAVVDLGGWWSPEAEVARDGRAHALVLDEPGASYAVWGEVGGSDPGCAVSDGAGTVVPVEQLPRDERVVLDRPGVADPETATLFTAPDDGAVTVTCEMLDATPTHYVQLTPRPSEAFFAVVRNAPWVVALLLFGSGLALLVLTAIRVARGPRREPVRRDA